MNTNLKIQTGCFKLHHENFQPTFGGARSLVVDNDFGAVLAGELLQLALVLVRPVVGTAHLSIVRCFRALKSIVSLTYFFLLMAFLTLLVLAEGSMFLPFSVY